MPAKKLLMLVGDYVEDYEVMVPFRRSRWWGMRSTQCARTNARAFGAHRHSRF